MPAAAPARPQAPQSSTAANPADSPSATAVASSARSADRSGLSGVLASAQTYPNPVLDGRFQVLLPEAFAGEISYTLLSALGARLATGHLTTGALAPTLAFDFSRALGSPGLYYLRLQSPGKQAAIRLVRP